MSPPEIDDQETAGMAISSNNIQQTAKKRGLHHIRKRFVLLDCRSTVPTAEHHNRTKSTLNASNRHAMQPTAHYITIDHSDN
jgi:hypothetical protein